MIKPVNILNNQSAFPGDIASSIDALSGIFAVPNEDKT
jgi:hypothetical protein